MAQLMSPITYRSYDGAVLTLYPWVGDNVALLTQSSSYDPAVMNRVIAGLDNGYIAYLNITGRAPTSYLTYDGKTSIAETPTAFNGAAAAIGYIGSTGIEITSPYVKILYDEVKNNNYYDQVLFYEMGRNFWFYSNQLGPVDPFVTGFAIANRFVSMELAGLNLTAEYQERKPNILEGVLSKYLSNSTETLGNTLSVGAVPAGSQGTSVADFAASVLYQVYEDFGATAYERFYRHLERLPTASTAEAAYGNFFEAARFATGIDYGFINKGAGTTYMVGTSSGDVLSLTPTRNVALGFGGADVVNGSQSADLIFGDGGDDQLYGDGGDDILVGGLGADVVNGGPGDDTLVGGGGNDVLIGGDGRDVAYFSGDSGGYRMSTAAGGAVIVQSLAAAGDGVDTLSGVERVRFADRAGAAEIGSPATRFSIAYAAANPDLFGAYGLNSLALDAHYVSYGRSEGRGAADFDAYAYAANNTDLLQAFGLDVTQLVSHYAYHGKAEGRTAGGFDVYAYAANNSDLFQAFGLDTTQLVSHYANHGRAEGRSAAGFDVYAYAANNSDLFQAFGLDITQLVSHYANHGRAEGRAAVGFDAEGYAVANADLFSAFGLDPTLLVDHYIRYGKDEGRFPGRASGPSAAATSSLSVSNEAAAAGLLGSA